MDAVAVLLTGGTGYIGSHTCVALLNAGYEVLVVDNLSNSSTASLKRVKQITDKQVKFFNVDLCDESKLEAVFKDHAIEAVIHFAGLKAVGESFRIPIEYYQNNITGTLMLCKMMKKYAVKNLVFSSSATVYSPIMTEAISEDFSLEPANPYGRTKWMVEEILRDLYVSDDSWSISLLRYFNPVGAHPSGLIGEDPKGIPNNLVPYITQVAVGKLSTLHVFGNDYPTIDGTGVRDYIHVVDLARGHLNALSKVMTNTGIEAYNLGTGAGYSVLQIVQMFEKVSGRQIPYTVVDRRPGDIAVCYANPSKAERELGWVAEKGLEEMCADAWRWQLNNPNGYEEEEEEVTVST